MAAGAFSDEFLLRSTEPTQKKKEEKKKKEKMNNLAVPGPRTNAQGSNRPFGGGPPHSDENGRYFIIKCIEGGNSEDRYTMSYKDVKAYMEPDMDVDDLIRIKRCFIGE